ncbi:hypothetical protein AB0L57_01940 [Nocardia sp. NPDC052254]|uniref:hypothetical protein n=1 Tax=Nocardia sp. NPDC052254 TaxID=3155681 RepID=UPI00342EB0B3
MTAGNLSAHGLTLELAPARLAGPVVPGRHPRRWATWPAQLPALALILVLLVGPAATTVWTAARAQWAMVAWCTLLVVLIAVSTVLWRAGKPKPGAVTEQPVALAESARDRTDPAADGTDPLVDTAAPWSPAGGPVSSAAPGTSRSSWWRKTLRQRKVGVGESRRRRWPRWQSLWWPILVAALAVTIYGIGVELGPSGRGAYFRTLLWVLCGVGVLALALELAWHGRRGWWPWQPLILPFGVSAFVAGLALRLLTENPGYRMPVPGVTGQRIWLMSMLIVAFLWCWLGALFCLFRAAIAAIEADPVRRGYLEDAGTTIRTRMRLLELVRPVFLILGLVVAVAAARIFDLVLIAVPGALQYSLDSATVHWWRLVSDPDADPGVAAAYSLPLAVLIGSAAWILQTTVRRHRVGWIRRPGADPVRARRNARGMVRVGVVSLLSIGPLVALGIFSWAGADGPAFTGPGSVWQHRELLHAMANTGWVAIWATVLVLGAAFPVTHRLAALPADAPLSRLAVVVLVVFTVLPAQLYVGPIRHVIDLFGLSGTSISSLIVVHAAIGLPIAILILRGALLAPADSSVADTLRGLARPWAVLGRLVSTAWPAVGAVAVLELVQVWNDFFVGLLVSGADVSPWSLLLWGDARQFQENSAHLAAGALLSTVPPVLLLLATWRRFLVPGLTGGFVR